MANLNVPGLITAFYGRLSFLKNRTQWAKGIVCFGVVFGGLAWAKGYVGLLYSPTGSLPHHLFLHLKQVEPKKGDYACVASSWYGGMLVKEIAGTAGDILTYDATGNLWVGRQLRVGKPKKKAKDGRTLTPIKPGVIPKGMAFVMGSHERSFDSRYEELGLVPKRHLRGRAIALL